MSTDESNNTNDGQSRLTVGLGKKMCLLCENFVWEAIDMSCGSDETGCWLEGGAVCVKGHYGFYENRPDDKRDMLALFLKAEKCNDYTPNAIELTGAEGVRVE